MNPCSSMFYQVVMVLNLLVVMFNGGVLSLLAAKLLKQRKNGLNSSKVLVSEHQYEHVDKMYVPPISKGGQLIDEGIYHVPEEQNYVNDAGTKKIESYLEVN
jgi:hypothetical protein